MVMSAERLAEIRDLCMERGDGAAQDYMGELERARDEMLAEIDRLAAELAKHQDETHRAIVRVLHDAGGWGVTIDRFAPGSTWMSSPSWRVETREMLDKEIRSMARMAERAGIVMRVVDEVLR